MFDGVNTINSVSEDGQVFDTEEVELEEAGAILVHRMHVVLRDDLAAVLCIELYRNNFIERDWRDHYTGCMHRDVARTAFDLLGHVDDLTRLVIAVVHFFEIRGDFDGVIDSHGHTLRAHRNEFGNSIACGIRKTESACHIAYGTAGHHRTERSDLSHFVRAVLVTGIFDYFVAAIIGIVHVDIGSRRTLRIKETLKGKFVRKRVHIRNTSQIGDDRSGHRASNSSENAALMRKTQEI